MSCLWILLLLKLNKNCNIALTHISILKWMKIFSLKSYKFYLKHPKKNENQSNSVMLKI